MGCPGAPGPVRAVRLRTAGPGRPMAPAGAAARRRRRSVLGRFWAHVDLVTDRL